MERAKWLEVIDDPQPTVDGRDGTARVGVNQADVEVLKAMAVRTASDPPSDLVTGGRLVRLDELISVREIS